MDGEKGVQCMCGASIRTRSTVAELGNICGNCNGIIVVDPSGTLPTYENAAELSMSRVLPEVPGRAGGCDRSEMGLTERTSPGDDTFSDGIFGATRRVRRPPGFDLPKFSGGKGANPKHYFLKLKGYFKACGVTSVSDQVDLVSQSLDGEAMDLYLSLSAAQQTDLDQLEEIFEDHFRPVAHGYLAVAELLKLCKGPRETVSEYYFRLKKFADRRNVATDMVKFAFVQGLPRDYQKHLTLTKGLVELEDIYKESLDFERASALEFKAVGPQANVVDGVGVKDLATKFDRVMDEIHHLRQEVQQRTTPTRDSRDEKQENGFDSKLELVMGEVARMRQDMARSNGPDVGKKGGENSTFWKEWFSEDKKNSDMRTPKQVRFNEDKTSRGEDRLCYFCRQKGHLKRSCAKYTEFLQQKRRSYVATVAYGKPCELKYTFAILNGHTQPSDLGFRGAWGQDEILLVNYAYKSLQVSGMGVNRGMTLLAETHAGIDRVRGTWNGMEVSSKSLHPGEFVTSSFLNNTIAHTVLPGWDELGTMCKSLNEVYDLVGRTITRILKFARKRGIGNVWVPLVTHLEYAIVDGSRREQFKENELVVCMNRAILRAVQLFSQKCTGVNISINKRDDFHQDEMSRLVDKLAQAIRGIRVRPVNLLTRWALAVVASRLV